jgi:undecaprenyl-diphosphatase
VISLHLAVLAVIQGVTEFLPVSSSGHLVLVPLLTGWQDQGLVIDVAVHVGSLGAVLIYFWRDIWAMLTGLGRLLRGRRSPSAALVFYVIVGTLPLVAAGAALEYYQLDAPRTLALLGWTTLGGGVLLYISDKTGMTVRRMDHMSFGVALLIGLFQIAAILPGMSRSGITMTAARFCGFERPDAARFSMLLSIPAILGAGILKGRELLDGSAPPELTHDVLVAAGLAFITALIAIAIMMSWLRRASFTPFVIYRLLLGAALLALAYQA